MQYINKIDAISIYYTSFLTNIMTFNSHIYHKKKNEKLINNKNIIYVIIEVLNFFLNAFLYLPINK